MTSEATAYSSKNPLRCAKPAEYSGLLACVATCGFAWSFQLDMSYNVVISAERIRALFTWQLSERGLASLRRSIRHGGLGPARILKVEQLLEGESGELPEPCLVK